MPLTDAVLQTLGNTLASELLFMATFSADPGSTGVNETTGGGYTRQAVTMSVDGDGDLTLPSTESFTGPANDPVSHIGFFSAVSGGTFKGAFARSGDASYSSAGAYNVTAGTITGTSTG